MNTKKEETNTHENMGVVRMRAEERGLRRYPLRGGEGILVAKEEGEGEEGGEGEGD